MEAIVSIGYEGRELEGFVEVLRSSGVDLLVDVRLTPISRKPGFSKRALADALTSKGMKYRHVPQLGNPKENRPAFQNGALAAGKRRYLEHLNGTARSAYEELITSLRTVRLALLCVERDDRECHRGCIIEQALQDQPGLSVLRL